MKTTEWFPGTTDPDMPGVYQVKYQLFAGFTYKYFNGIYWGAAGGTPAIAERRQDMPSSYINAWRGLAENPER